MSGKNYNDFDGFDLQSRSSKVSNRDIYSHSVTDTDRDIYSDSASGKKSSNGKKRRKKKRHLPLKILISLLLCVVLAFGALYAYAYSVISKIEYEPLDTENLAVNSADYATVKNIALFGIDSRENSEIGRSDAILVLSIDKEHNKIKLTSFARDSYVQISGHGGDKLTHAYAYGRNELAVKTLNQNYGLEITDYVTVNFYGFVNIIDYVGGVVVDVDDAELKELNRNIMPYTAKEMGLESQPISNSGRQKLNGIQALCYARIRHTDSDLERGNRQKEVMSALLDSVKSMNIIDLPKLASMVMAECKTSLSSDTIMSMGLWAVVRSPELVQYSIPNDDIPSSGKTISGKWCYYYDLSLASDKLKKFILEK